MRPAAILLLLLGGCAASTPPRPPVVLLGAQLQKEDDELVGRTFRTLLDFEHPADDAFVQSVPTDFASSEMDPGGHTGARAFARAAVSTVGVDSLLFGLTLPADFTLLGAYVRPSGGGPVTAVLLADGVEVARTVRDVPPRIWGFAAIDLTTPACRHALPAAKSIRLRFDAPGGLMLDDVLLVDNRRDLVDVPGVWTVSRIGLSLAVRYAGGAAMTIPTLAAGGWAVDEINPLRVRLHDAAGRPWTLLSDGRSIRDGTSTPATPAELTAEPSAARLDRETPGDADNDGYNEQRAAFELVARAPRLQFRLAPRGTQGKKNDARPPLVEIRGLPADVGAITVDGRLVDRVARLQDGTLLVMLPAPIDAAVEVTVGVRGG